MVAPGCFAKNVRHFRTMQSLESRAAPLWKKELLQFLPGALLFSGNAGKNSGSHARKRTEYAAPSSDFIHFPRSGGNEKQESGKIND